MVEHTTKKKKAMGNESQEWEDWRMVMRRKKKAVPRDWKVARTHDQKAGGSGEKRGGPGFQVAGISIFTRYYFGDVGSPLRQ